MKRCLNCMNEYPDEYGDLCPSCGYMEGATQNGGMYLQAGSILGGRYIVGTVLKERDTDIFYIGWDALFDRRVQIQEYFPKYCAARSGKPEVSIYDNKQDRYQEGLELFYQQSRQLIRLYKEENVITYHACFRENKTAYAIMDYSQDITLKTRLESSLFRTAEAQNCLDEAIAAVMKVHQIGVYHGQISPDSFWEKPGGGLVLKDFGASRYISGEPGIVDYGSAGPHTDVYGLAKMFCQLITGKEIEDGEKLESELSRKQIALKKPVVAALKRALNHQTRTVEAFQKELWGRKKIPNSRKKKKNHGSLTVPRWVIAAAALVMAGLLVFTGLVATGKIDLRLQMGESRLDRGQTRVPNVVNKSKKEAERLLKKNKLKMSEGKKVYDEQIAENMVSYQSFPQNAVVEKNTTVVVNFSLGPEKGVFPQIINRGREEALEMLKEARFMNIREEESPEEGVFDSVLSASEEPGENVALSKEIVLFICKKEAAKDIARETLINVPDVSGKEKAEAEKLLSEAGFSVQWVEENSDQAEGAILGQEPAAGESAAEGSPVSVRISIGPEKLYMVNVELETEEEAKKIITDMGLTVGEITKEYSETVGSGKVISQSIAMDTEVNPKDTVNLVVSLGEDPGKKNKEETPAPTQKPKSTQAPQATAPVQTAPALPPTQAPEPTQPAPEQSPAPTQENSSSGGVSGGSAGSSKPEGISGNSGAGGSSAENQGSAGAGGSAGNQGPAGVGGSAGNQGPAGVSGSAGNNNPAGGSGNGSTAQGGSQDQAPPETPAPAPPPTSAPVQTQAPAQTVEPLPSDAMAE